MTEQERGETRQKGDVKRAEEKEQEGRKEGSKIDDRDYGHSWHIHTSVGLGCVGMEERYYPGGVR